MKRLVAGGVVDASVAVKLVRLNEPLVEQGLAVLRQLSTSGSRGWAAPDIFDVECANAMRKASRHGGLSVSEALDGLDLLLHLPHRRVVSRLVASTALALSLEWGVSVYDACYVALSTMLAVPFVTADRRLASALEQSGHEVIFLGDVLI